MTKNRIDSDLNIPTTTAHQARLRIWQPSTHPVLIERFSMENSWGKLTTTGKVGQMHAGLMESINRCAESKRELADGGYELLVDPYKLRMMTYGGKQGSYDGIWKMLQDLQSVTIDYQIPKLGLNGIGGILVYADKVEKEKQERSNPLKNKVINDKTSELHESTRQMYKITVDKNYVKLMSKDLPLFYDPKKFAQLNTGIAQAVARFIYTHSKPKKNDNSPGWSIDYLIQAVGGGTNTKQLQNHRAWLKSDEEGLKSLGVTIRDGKLTRDS